MQHTLRVNLRNLKDKSELFYQFIIKAMLVLIFYNIAFGYNSR